MVRLGKLRGMNKIKVLDTINQPSGCRVKWDRYICISVVIPEAEHFFTSAEGSYLELVFRILKCSSV